VAGLSGGGIQDVWFGVVQRPGTRQQVQEARRVWDVVTYTIPREPVENKFSIYFLWLGLPATGLFHMKFLKERQSIEEFAKHYQLRNLMSEEYLGDFDMCPFEYIGFNNLRREALLDITSNCIC
jgi:hypothetical protein